MIVYFIEKPAAKGGGLLDKYGVKMSIFKKKKNIVQEQSSDIVLPVHIAIIPDGNRRWARAKNLPVQLGHREGAETFKKTVKYCGDIGIKYITFYAFSTENWKRDESEVKALMNILLRFLNNSDKELGDGRHKIAVHVIGDRSRLSDEVNKGIDKIEKDTAENTGIYVNIAINYGGRAELCDCVKKIAEEIEKGTISKEDITDDLIDKNLYTAGTPNPDLLIRTSGEMRISNFLLWQLAYTEFYFADVNWPDFDTKQLDKAIQAYSNRQRRYGGA